MVEPQTKPALRNRSNAWHWLLVFLFNAKDPYFLGFPRFYWLQLAFIALSVATTLVVYYLTKSGRAKR
jgi:hypothetical protein